MWSCSGVPEAVWDLGGGGGAEEKSASSPPSITLTLRTCYMQAPQDVF